MTCTNEFLKHGNILKLPFSQACPSIFGCSCIQHDDLRPLQETQGSLGLFASINFNILYYKARFVH